VIVKKFRNLGRGAPIRTQCRQGHSHPSKGEAGHCDVLYLALQAGKMDPPWVKIDYEKRYDLRVNGVLVGTHKPDWTVTRADGSQFINEFKGYHKNKREFQLRMKLFMALYPEIPYHIIGGEK